MSDNTFKFHNIDKFQSLDNDVIVYVKGNLNYIYFDRS